MTVAFGLDWMKYLADRRNPRYAKGDRYCSRCGYVFVKEYEKPKCPACGSSIRTKSLKGRFKKSVYVDLGGLVE